MHWGKTFTPLRCSRWAPDHRLRFPRPGPYISCIFPAFLMPFACSAAGCIFFPHLTLWFFTLFKKFLENPVDSKLVSLVERQFGQHGFTLASNSGLALPFWDLRWWKTQCAEAKCEKPFIGSFQWKISGSNGTSEKVVLFFRSECSKRKFVFHFFKAIFDTSFRPSRSFSGKWNWFVQMANAIPEWNLPVLNFAFHLPELWTDRFAHENGKKPLSWLKRETGQTKLSVICRCP